MLRIRRIKLLAVHPKLTSQGGLVGGLASGRLVIVQEPAYGEAKLQTSVSRKGVTYIINDMGWYREWTIDPTNYKEQLQQQDGE